MTEEHLDALPIGAMIQEYKILSILGTGGFGITYLGIDTHTDMKVAIKEYFPSFSAVRRESTVLPKSSSDKEDYNWGLESFLNEAKTVASGFPHHPNIVQVLRYIPANNTAYIIMRYEDGLPLDEILKDKDNTLTEKDLLENILLPLLDGLGKVHAAGFLHRDIKPANIYMRRSDESPVLLDFGAARNARAYAAEGRQMSQVSTASYEAIEQGDSGNNIAGLDQGAWTDIYGLGVVAYRIVANEMPPTSTTRNLTRLTKKDPLKPAVEVGRGRFSETVLKAIDHALGFLPEDRPQSCEEWKKELTAQTVTEPSAKPEAEKKNPKPPEKKKSETSNNKGEDSDEIMGESFGDTTPIKTNKSVKIVPILSSIFRNSYLEVFKRYFDFKGRSSRKEFWYFMLIHLSIIFLLGILNDYIYGQTAPPNESPLYIVIRIYVLLTFIPYVAVMIRRLHDRGFRMLWILLGPIAVILWVLDSEEGENKYGMNPKDTQT